MEPRCGWKVVVSKSIVEEYQDQQIGTRPTVNNRKRMILDLRIGSIHYLGLQFDRHHPISAIQEHTAKLQMYYLKVGTSMVGGCESDELSMVLRTAYIGI